MNFNPFAYFQRKSSAVTSLIVQFARASTWSRPVDFETQAKEGYQSNVTAYACINEISKAVAGIPWVLKRKGVSRGSKVAVIDDHPILDLLKKPNPWQGGGEFSEACTSFLLIGGNAYIEAVGPESGPPMELYTHRPDRFTVIPDNLNRIAGYKYEVNGENHKFLDGEILHRKLFSPLSEYYGLSPIQVAARDIDSDNEAARWNLSLLRNDMRPSGAFVTDGDLGDQQYQRLKKETDAQYIGAMNAGRPLFLDGGLKWENFTISPKDSDWLSGRKLSKREIAQVYQVPPELIGDGEVKTYSNYEEARKSFYVETILPYMDTFRDSLNNWLTIRWNESIVLDYDKDDIEALQEERDQLYERVGKATWMTLNEKRLATGLDEIDGGDVILVPMGMVPLQAVLDPKVEE